MTGSNDAPPERIREMFDRIADVHRARDALASGFQGASLAAAGSMLGKFVRPAAGRVPVP
ncbi:MAG: hypothetical protein IVW53_11135 [Chloroflexi bacterium]|nr:hypothetical protein [Chloroflexota bacterium]